MGSPDETSPGMPVTTADISPGSTVMFPPGTIRLEEMTAADGQRMILQPRPTDDPNDPLNWPNWRKYLNFGLVSFYVLMVSEFINSATPTWKPMRIELGFTKEILNASYAIGCAFLAIGALVLVPFALKFGRRPVHVVSSLVQCGVSVWSAKMHNVADLMLVNVLCTAFGALAEVIVQMTVADVFFIHQRGLLNSIYIWFWQVSVSLGPLIAGFITTGQGWRWVWWWNAICFGLFFIVVFFAYEETKYCPASNVSAPLPDGETPKHHCSGIVSDGDAHKLAPMPATLPSVGQSNDAISPTYLKPTEEGPSSNLYEIKINPLLPKKTYRQILALTTPSNSDGGFKEFLRHMYQPLILLTTVPAIAYTALVYGILIALQDVMSTTFSLYMTEPPYNFTPDQIGLMNLPKLVGVTIGSIAGGYISDRVIIYMARRNNGIFEPEFRLWGVLPFLPFIPAGALLFGFGLNNGLPWPVIAVGLALYKFGIAPVNSITITYLTDSYKDIIGDALVGVTVVRNTFSTAFIFAVSPWVDAVGIKWVIITIVLITTGILMLTGVFVKWGKHFRANTAETYHRYSLLQYKER